MESRAVRVFYLFNIVLDQGIVKFLPGHGSDCSWGATALELKLCVPWTMRQAGSWEMLVMTQSDWTKSEVRDLMYKIIINLKTKQLQAGF